MSPMPFRLRSGIKRFAFLGFLFFLLKGLAWLLVGFLAWRGLS